MSDIAFVLRMMCVSTVLALISLTASAADLRVVVSGGFAQAYKDLTPSYEQSSGDYLISGWGPSMGNTVNAIPARLARGEAALAHANRAQRAVPGRLALGGGLLAFLRLFGAAAREPAVDFQFLVV